MAHGGDEPPTVVDRLKRAAVVLVAGGALLATTIALLVPAAALVAGAHEADPVDEIDLEALSQRSSVLDRNGKLMTYLYREENRELIRLDDIPDVVIDTVLAVEDEGFFEHDGIDVQAIGRAFLTNVEAGDVEQGGSTITQQLVKNALLDPEQSLSRKVREAVLAVRLEDTMSKREILERYLNTVYLGNGTYGLQAAAELYFGIDAGELKRAQAAFLTGLIRNPVGYDPFEYPKESRERRNTVVGILLEKGEIDGDEAARIRRAPVPRTPFELVPKPKDYFMQEVLRRLLDDPRLGETQSDRYNALFRGGLTIKTTYDPEKQWLATSAVREVLPDTGGMFTAAVVSVEPGTGAVRAMVGGPGFEEAKYNITTQGIGRQPGSAFKPFVLAAALEKGISPRSTINGAAPCSLPNKGGTPDPWRVDNYEGSRGGVMDLSSAIRRSMNCAFARLALVTGLSRVARTAERLGITTPLPEVPSMALGSLEVRPIEMAAAFAAFATDGRYVAPYYVDEVRDRTGRVIFRHEPEPRRAISRETARIVTSMLQGVVTGGTGTRARLPGRDVAGKTGTTSDYADAWFVGYTPQLSTAVWMGSPTGTSDKMRNVGGIRVTGGSYPARIWRAFMEPALAGEPPVEFADPPRFRGGGYLHIEGESDEPPRPTTTTAAPPPPPPPPVEEEGGADERPPPADEGGGDGGAGEGGEEQPPPPDDGEGGNGNGNGNGNGHGNGNDDPDAGATSDDTESGASGQTEESG